MKFISVRKVKAEWNIYLNKKWNDMMPMPTFDWNILSFTVVYDSAENRKTTYKKVTAQQESKAPTTTCPSLLHDATVMRHQDCDLLRYTASTDMIDLGELEKKKNMMSS